jgi:hypothetical protein
VRAWDRPGVVGTAGIAANSNQDHARYRRSQDQSNETTFTCLRPACSMLNQHRPSTAMLGILWIARHGHRIFRSTYDGRSSPRTSVMCRSSLGGADGGSLLASHTTASCGSRSVMRPHVVDRQALPHGGRPFGTYPQSGDPPVTLAAWRLQSAGHLTRRSVGQLTRNTGWSPDSTLTARQALTPGSRDPATRIRPEAMSLKR